MKIYKKITILFILILLWLIPSAVRAESITVTNVTSGFANGSISLKVSNIDLSSDGNYVWGVSKSSSSDTVTTWYTLADFSAANSTASILLTVQESEILEILRTTNTVHLFIKDSDSDTLLLDGEEADVTLDPLYAFDYCIYNKSYYICGGDCLSTSGYDQWEGATYNIETAYYKFEEITDEDIIDSYKQALLDGTSLSDVFDITTSQIESLENWTGCTRDYSYPYTKIDKSKIPTDQGVYYLYIKAKDTDSKIVYGVFIINVDGDGPTVSSIQVVSPSSGTYSTGQTVKIRAYFSETITGSTVPTLKIKFGDSSVRTITSGTLVNTNSSSTSSYGHYIEYTYDIQSSDVGQLATVSYTGGNIVDASGNEATITCPVITGYTIIANEEKNSSNTNTSDTNSTNTNTNSSSTNNTNTSNSNSSNTNSNKNTNTDSTTYSGTLPYTGVKNAIILASLSILAIMGYTYFRYNKYKGID